MSKNLCGQCRTFEVPKPGDLCGDCREKNRKAQERLIADLKKKPPKDPKK